MRRLIYIIICLAVAFFFSCSTYTIEKDIKDSPGLSKIKKAGLIFRISNGSKISKDELVKNFLPWISIYKKQENITILTDANNSLSYFQPPQERFYQLSNEDKYLKYKSIGVLNVYLQSNQDELRELISKYTLDGIIIYEVFSVISSELQFFDIESSLAIVDSNLNIAYFDHQADTYDTENSSKKELKYQTMDLINSRLIKNLQEIDFLGDNSEPQKKVVMPGRKSIEEKQIEKTVEKPTEKAADKPAEKQEESTEEIEKSVEKPVEKPAETTAPQPVEKPSEKTTDKSEKSVEQLNEKPANIELENSGD